MDNILIKGLVFLFFLTLPSYALDDFRLWIGPVSITVNLLILAVFMIILVLNYFSGSSRILINKDMKLLINLIFLFAIYHLFSFLSSCDIVIGEKYVFKTFGALFIFVSSYLFTLIFIHSRQELGDFLIIAIFSSTIILLIYIYRYAIVFHSPYLGTEWAFPSESGKKNVGNYKIKCVGLRGL